MTVSSERPGESSGEDSAEGSGEGGLVRELSAILRLHIVGVGCAAMLVFGWIATGQRFFWLVPVVAIDWFAINLVNRVTDLAEDLENGIPGTARVARRKNLFLALSVGLFASSLAVTHAVWPALTPWRLVVEAIGVLYNYRLIPVPASLARGRGPRGGAPSGWGLARFKELYFFKNTMSAVLFVLTCFVYPVAAAGALVVPVATVVVLVAFFVPFELTYEILYDFRDLEGDRREGVPTYPVVHGPLAARRLLDALLGLSVAALALGLGLGWLGLREGLMVVAPLAQLGFYRPRFARGLTHDDCVWLTHLGTAQLALFLVGTELWLRAGLPANVFLR